MKLLTLALSMSFVASAASITVGFNQPDFPHWPDPLSPADAQPVFGAPAQASVNFRTLPRFDPALGTLTWVDYSITSLYTFDDTIHNGTGSDIDVQIATGDISTFDDTVMNVADNSLALTPVGYFLLAGHTIELTGGGSVTSTAHLDFTNAAADLTNHYIGSDPLAPLFVHFRVGNQIVFYDPSLNPYPDPPAGITYGPSGTYEVSVAVTYNYDPATTAAPEPVSLLLVGGALAGLGLRRRGC